MRLQLALSALLLLVSAAPSPAADGDAPQPDRDGWYQLFNGKDLTGWKLSRENQDSIRVENGAIVTNGPPCHAFYDGPVENHDFKNFQWKCEIMTKPKSNSGMYFHTKYQAEGWPQQGIEIQVNNTHGDPIKTGSLYRLKNIMNDAPAKDNEWFTQEVIVEGNKVTVKVNDKVVNQYTQPEDLKREPGWEKAIIGSGTFALQAHDPVSEVHYRKVMVKPLP
ncbi:MAG: DUF1080 domain-containing protein [Planctomycetota bacterium]|nr:MAG: DUF1080 domain-containing protein [Planctomycetota bacterium]